MDDQLQLFEMSERFELVDLEEEDNGPDGYIAVLLVPHEQGGPQ